MLQARIVRTATVALLAAWFVAPDACVRAEVATASAATSTGRSAKSLSVKDVRLLADGTLRGQLVTSEGAELAKQQVQVLQRDRSTLAQTVTDEKGRFTFAGLHGGTYLIAAKETVGVIRVWKPGTAPPTASGAVLIVSQDETLRGQNSVLKPGSLGAWVGLGTVITTAAVIQHQRQGFDRPPGS